MAEVDGGRAGIVGGSACFGGAVADYPIPIGESVMFDAIHDKPNLLVTNPPLSEWECALFGTGFNYGIVLKPARGDKIPNRFWRWMQFLFFGNRWRKRKNLP